MKTPVLGSSRKTRYYSVPYNGRWVSSHWFRHYGSGKNPARRVRTKSQPIIALFFLPRIESVGEPAELRFVDLSNGRTVEWVKEMFDGYASIQTLRPTFFPKFKSP